MVSLSSNKERLARFIELAWNRENLNAVDEYLAPLYRIHHDPGDPWEGLTLDVAGFKERLVTSRAVAPDQKFRIEDMIGEENRVVAIWTWKGTHLGEIAGIPASGKVITMSGLTAYSFRGKRLTGHWQVADRLGVYRQLM